MLMMKLCKWGGNEHMNMHRTFRTHGLTLENTKESLEYLHRPLHITLVTKSSYSKENSRLAIGVEFSFGISMNKPPNWNSCFFGMPVCTVP